MTARELETRFNKLKEAVKNEPEATEKRVSEFENEWCMLYDAACWESGNDTGSISDDEYDEICNFRHDHIAQLANY